MDVEERLKLIRRRPTEEILTEDRLREILFEYKKPRHYIGFEISGFVHIGTGIYCMEKVVDFQKAKVETNIFLADWHSYINKKLGGNWERIKRIAKGYFQKSLEKCIEILGGDSEKTKFVLGSEIYDGEYWEILAKIGREVTLRRVLRSLSILGRKMGEGVPWAWTLYPIMQVADIFKLNVQIAHAGIDQRKAHVIAIDVAEKIGFEKPVAVHHSLMSSLSITDEHIKKISEAKTYEERISLRMDIKMSKSKPETCIFIHDSPNEIRKKIRKAYCPWGKLEYNPIVDMVRDIILRKPGEFEIVNRKTGERTVFTTFNEFKEAWINRKIFPADLKDAVAEYLINLLEPVRKYFEGKGSRYLEEMQKISITR